MKFLKALIVLSVAVAAVIVNAQTTNDGHEYGNGFNGGPKVYPITLGPMSRYSTPRIVRGPPRKSFS